ncbi:MAG: MBL fold metallo-hydrolase, partial [Bacillota bacterium]|nr:MBL fold metallo-hydrolase [Bacillota bacterium]
FATSHDSAFSVGYVLNCGGISYAVATDNGKLTSDFAQSLRGCDTVLIEANYDQFMLENGAYPYYLKKRIASCTGHMSNEQAGKLACALARSGTKRIALGHLSKENNTPKTAYNTVLNMLKDEGLSVSLGVAARYDITDLLKIEPSDNELSPALPVL